MQPKTILFFIVLTVFILGNCKSFKKTSYAKERAIHYTNDSIIVKGVPSFNDCNIIIENISQSIIVFDTMNFDFEKTFFGKEKKIVGNIASNDPLELGLDEDDSKGEVYLYPKQKIFLTRKIYNDKIGIHFFYLTLLENSKSSYDTIMVRTVNRIKAYNFSW